MILFFIISSFLDSVLYAPELKYAYYGITILQLDNDSMICNLNGQKLFIPASNMKLITTAAALHFLGPGFRYKTRLLASGRIDDDRLAGRLVLFGQGDPAFSLDDMERFVRRVKARGIREVTEGIAVLDDYFSDERLPIGWAWHYLDACYAPEISALSLNKNCVKVRIKPTKVGEPADVQMVPVTGYVKMQSVMMTKEGDDSIIIFRRPDANFIYVDGAVGNRRARDIDVAVKDPAMFAGEYFKERLIAEGIDVKGAVVREKTGSLANGGRSFSALDSVLSPGLIEIINWTNTESENLYAEILLKTMGAEVFGEGSFKKGIQAVKDFLGLCGVSAERLSLWDGSGLSKYNLVTPYDLVLVLRYMYHDQNFRIFYESLAEPGKKGTLERRFNGFADTLRAKTGMINSESNLSGYLRVNGTDYCFSMLFNNITGSQKRVTRLQELVLQSFAESLKQSQ
jgi:PBP4 family serine-type D-alanyl-D-alanine carboxypeptidase